MRQIFIFTAGKKEARQHLDDSIINSVSFSLLDDVLPKEEADNIRSLMPNQEGFYAWGAVTGIQNIPRWEVMQPGDLVLSVYENTYHYFSTVLAKLHSQDLAERIWGIDDEGKTWEYMYFLSPPQKIQVRVDHGALGELLNKSYRGFTRISDDKVKGIVEEYGSMDLFVQKELNAFIPLTPIQEKLRSLINIADAEDLFDPHSEVDGRNKILREVVRRQGQPQFRSRLLEAYERKCAVTGCDVEFVLEAAHIKAYDGANSNAVQNGLLLRADIHTLFDLGELKIDETGEIHLSERLLLSAQYKELDGKEITKPRRRQDWPSSEALRKKFNFA